MHQTTKSPADDLSLNADSGTIHKVSGETETRPHGTRIRRNKSEGQYPSRFRYLINTIAAVLVVGIIIGASLLLFTHHPATPATGGQPTQTIPGSGFCHLDVDPGLHYVCQNHLYQNIYQSKQMGKYTITIQQAYADANRIAISYSVIEGKQDLTMYMALSPVSITINQSIHIDFLRGGASLVKGGTAAAMSFYLPASLQQKTLAVQVNIGGISYYDNPNRVNSTIAFSFMLPFHAEKRVITLHQSTTANGIRMTLESAILSLSDTEFTLSYHIPASSKVFPGTVNIFSSNISYYGIVANPRITIQAAQQASIPCPIFTAHGQWTLTIQAIGVSSSSNNSQPPSWIFHFTIPVA